VCRPRRTACPYRPWPVESPQRQTGALDRLPTLRDQELVAIIEGSLRQHLAVGVTTVRDLGEPALGGGDWRSRQRDHIASLSLATVVASGPPITSQGETAGTWGGVSGKLGTPDDVACGRQALAFVASRREPSDVVLADRWALGHSSSTGRGSTCEPMAWWPWTGRQMVGAIPIHWLASAGHPGCGWCWAHHFSGDPATRNETYESQFAARATVRASYRGAGDAAAYLFDLSKVPRSPVTATRRMGGSWLLHGETRFRLTTGAGPRKQARCGDRRRFPRPRGRDESAVQRRAQLLG